MWELDLQALTILLVGIVIFYNKGKFNNMSQDKQHFVKIIEKSWKVLHFRTKKCTSKNDFSVLKKLVLSSQRIQKFQKSANFFLWVIFFDMPHIRGFSNADCHVPKCHNTLLTFVDISLTIPTMINLTSNKLSPSQVLFSMIHQEIYLTINRLFLYQISSSCCM